MAIRLFFIFDKLPVAKETGHSLNRELRLIRLIQPHAPPARGLSNGVLLFVSPIVIVAVFRPSH